MWLDNWHPFGSLYEKFGFRVIYDAHSTLNATFNSVIKKGDWCWKPTRSEDLVAIQSRLPDVHLGDVDKPIWTITSKCVYESVGTWNYMRNKKQEIRWWPLIWFPHTIPKQGIIESCDHLFFQCSFSSRIWRTCMRHCSILNPPLDWHDVIDEGCSKWKTKKLLGVLCRLLLSSVVYHIWRARNEIKFQGRPKTKDQILRAIFWEVRTRITGKGKFKKN